MLRNFGYRQQESRREHARVQEARLQGELCVRGRSEDENHLHPQEEALAKNSAAARWTLQRRGIRVL